MLDRDPIPIHLINDAFLRMGVKCGGKVYPSSVAYHRQYLETRESLERRVRSEADAIVRALDACGWYAHVGTLDYMYSCDLMSIVRIDGPRGIGPRGREILDALADGFEVEPLHNGYKFCDVSFVRRLPKAEMDAAMLLYCKMDCISLHPVSTPEHRRKLRDQWTRRPFEMRGSTMVPFLLSPESDSCDRKCEQAKIRDKGRLSAVCKLVGGRAASANVTCCYNRYGFYASITELNDPSMSEDERHELALRIAREFGSELVYLGVDRDGVYLGMLGPDFSQENESYWNRNHGKRTISMEDVL